MQFLVSKLKSKSQYVVVLELVKYTMSVLNSYAKAIRMIDKFSYLAQAASQISSNPPTKVGGNL